MKHTFIALLSLLLISCNEDPEVNNCQYTIEIDYVDGAKEELTCSLPSDAMLKIERGNGTYSLYVITPSCSFCSNYRELVPGVIRYRVIDKDCSVKNTTQKM